MSKNIVQKQQSVDLEVGIQLPIEIFRETKEKFDNQIIKPEIKEGFHFTNDIKYFFNEIIYMKSDNLAWLIFKELGHYTCYRHKGITMKRLMKKILRNYSYFSEIPKNRKSFDLRMSKLFKFRLFDTCLGKDNHTKFYYLSQRAITLWLLLFKFHDNSKILYMPFGIINQANLQCETMKQFSNIDMTNNIIKLEVKRLEAQNKLDIFEIFELLEKPDKITNEQIKQWLEKQISRLSDNEFDESRFDTMDLSEVK